MTLPRYGILVSPEAEDDIDNIYDYIAFNLFSPATAEKYIDGIYDTIRSLALTGNMFAVNYGKSLQRQYGPHVRTIRYKKMAIIYTVRGDLIVVHSVRAGKTIK